ncbi:MAG: DNRLRE domain-containing protein, partial [Actinomycetota bacterium]|nr:DNRLRE domain-containing protein [Actinomycetota bacterium]
MTIHHDSTTSARRHQRGDRVRNLLVGLCSLAVLTGGMVAIPHTASAATAPRDLKPLASTPAPRTTPQLPVGDFSNRPPSPDQLAGRRPTPKGAAFDAARSTPLDDQTTATRRVYVNADGSHTAAVSPAAVRYQSPDGRWTDTNLDLAAAPDGSLSAKAAASSARLAPTADGTATLPTPNGPITLRNADAAQSKATVSREKATYPKALPGGRDLSLALVPDGVEQSVVVPSAQSPTTYLNDLTLPPGLSAREATGGIEFVDGAGAVVATFGGAMAYDASFPKVVADNMGPVGVHIVDVKGGAVTVEVGVDPGWLAAPGRAFPVTVDPWLVYGHSSNEASNRDTNVIGGSSANTSFGTSPYLGLGSTDGGVTVARDLLWFDVSSLGATASVTNAFLRIDDWYSASCSPTGVNLYGLGGSFSASSTWNTQPALDASGLVSSPSFAAGATGCAGAWQNLDATSLAQRWVVPATANFGIGLRAASETDANSAKWFYSGRSAYPPTLYITYDHLPGLSTPVTPTAGAVLNTATPVLATTTATDTDPTDVVQYWFRASAAPGAESGTLVADSGWVTAPGAAGCAANQVCYKFADGALADGVTYYWHVWTYDGFLWHFPQDGPGGPPSFRVQLGLGADGPLPRDSVGPVSVNLGTGNVAMAASSPTLSTVGGPAGVSYAYNSQALPNLGLSARYFNDPDPAHPPTSPAIMDTLLPQLVRQDPTIDHNWGSDGPGGGVGTDNFLARWTGYVTVPTGGSGSYNLNSDHDDGIVVRLGGTLAGGKMTGGTTVLNHWADGTFTNPSEGAAAYTLTAGVPVAIQVDYHEHVGSAFASVWSNGPLGLSQMLPSWLTPDPAITSAALPQGWTLGVTGLGYTSATLGQGFVAFVDTSGASHAYTWTGSGFAPAPGEDGVAAYDANGGVTLDAGGKTYAFDPAGRLASASTATDDIGKSSLRYTWSTSDPNRPVRLLAVIDGTDTAPTPTRKISLHYSGRETCPTPPSGYTAVPIDNLCQVDYWDGTHTYLAYSAGQLARIEDPGTSVTEATYTGALLTRVRTPLVYDAVLPPLGGPVVPNDDTTRVTIAYGAPRFGRATKVTLPVPNAGALVALPRPAHSYTFPTDTQGDNQVDFHTRVHVDGLTEPAARPYIRQLDATRDTAANLSVTDANVDGVATSATFDSADRITSATDAAGRRSTTIYDADAARAQPTGRPTDTYGPAPASCFGANGVPNATCTGNATPPHTATTYDADPSGVALTGLGATYWPNLTLSGSPAAHGTASPDPSTGALAADPPVVDDGTALVTPLVARQWSGRYVGELDATGATSFSLVLTGKGRLWVDDRLVVDAWSAHSSLSTVSGTSPVLSAGRHRFRIDYAGPGGTTGSAQVQLQWASPAVALPAAKLAPRFSEPTKGVTDDTTAGVSQRTSTTAYRTMSQGLDTTQTADPGTGGPLNLVSKTTYEDPTTGGYLRPRFRDLPADGGTTTNTRTTYAYYSPTDPIPTTTCGSLTAAQAGALHTATAADPDGPGPLTARVDEYVHDARGRVVASRYGADTTWSCTTYDDRNRITSASFPPNGTQPARSVTYNYAVGANPLVTSVTDPAGTITTTVDLLGQVVSYTDVWGNPTLGTSTTKTIYD